MHFFCKNWDKWHTIYKSWGLVQMQMWNNKGQLQTQMRDCNVFCLKWNLGLQSWKVTKQQKELCSWFHFNKFCKKRKDLILTGEISKIPIKSIL